MPPGTRPAGLPLRASGQRFHLLLQSNVGKQPVGGGVAGSTACLHAHQHRQQGILLAGAALWPLAGRLRMRLRLWGIPSTICLVRRTAPPRAAGGERRRPSSPRGGGGRRSRTAHCQLPVKGRHRPQQGHPSILFSVEKRLFELSA